MANEQLTFLSGVTRWLPESESLEFRGMTDRGTVLFQVPTSVLATLAEIDGRLEPAEAFSAFFSFEDKLQLLARRAFAGATGRRSSPLRIAAA